VSNRLRYRVFLGAIRNQTGEGPFHDLSEAGQGGAAGGGGLARSDCQIFSFP
jgi:hypothetical protein